jgi:replicative DNA helicase
MTTSNTEKVKLPFNLELEQALLGSLLVDNRGLERLPERFGEAHFYNPVHGEIFAGIQETVSSNQLASASTLKTSFGEQRVGEAPIADYLLTLIGLATATRNVRDYAGVLLDLSRRRSLMAAAEDLVLSCSRSAPDMPFANIVESFEATLLKVSEASPTGHEEISFEAALDEAIDRANAAHQGGTGIIGLPTGIKTLDAMMGGLAPSDLIVLGGRPGMGKTALATNIAFNVASKFHFTSGGGGAPVHFFSQEMSAEQLATRVLAEQAEVASEMVRRGTFKDGTMAKLMATRDRINKAPIIIDQTGGLSIAQLISRARRLKRKHNTGLIIVDYLQLMYGSTKENRNQDLTRITNGLKALAKELNVPILALSQLSRGVENRDDKRPHLADLRESGSIEQDADIVMFVYREEYYLARKKDEKDALKLAEWQTAMANAKGKAEVIFGKHRHGQTGIVELQFNSEVTRFADLATPSIHPDVYR